MDQPREKKVTTASATKKAGRRMPDMENEQKLKRAEAIQLRKKREWQRRRHLGIKRKRSVMTVESLNFDEFEEFFPKTSKKTFYVMSDLIGGEMWDDGFDPSEFDEDEDWDYSSSAFEDDAPDEEV
jgi:hypothetical protein